jgi:hypothetical protein
MKITNAIGTSSASCSCASWFAHWEKLSGQTTNFCQATDCSNASPCGAHVKKVGDSTVYIYPLCSKCNQRIGMFEVSALFKFVSANEAETCGKRYSLPGYYR